MGGARTPNPVSGFGSMFSYVWANSRREQIFILTLVLLSIPFYFASLELPKSIVNDAIQGRAFANQETQAVLFRFTVRLPAFLGGVTLIDFPGFALTRIGYLFSLCAAFLALVLINGGFKYVINLRKGKLGERILRKLRFDLFSQLLLFTPEAIRNVKPSEAATIIKDEVEPIGGFVGDAFIQPVFLSGQALTALLFIGLQNLSLGILAATIVALQGVIIPRLRREQLRLSKERQIKSRLLAGRIGEVVEGMAEVNNHSAGGYERLKIADMLDQLFWIRYRLFDRKFRVKFLNNLLAQLTPLLFYSVGGYYALNGSLDIGQLVAVIAAYRDVPPPVKELIDWDQERLDVEVKFNQVVEQFAGSNRRSIPAITEPLQFDGAIETHGLRVIGAAGETLLDNVTLTIPIGVQTALVASTGDGASILAQAIGRRITAYSGAIKICGHDLAQLSSEEIGRSMAYAGADAIIFQGSIRDNLIYGLRLGAAAVSTTQANTVAESDIDYALAGATSAVDLDERITEALQVVGFGETIYRLGLNRTIDPVHEAGLADRIVAARRALSERLATEASQHLIERFTRDQFSHNATIGENLLFGVAMKDELAFARLASHPIIRRVLDEETLTAALQSVGQRIASTMIEIFGDLSGDHFLVEQFSFMSLDEIPMYREILARVADRRDGAVSIADSGRLISLALRYSEPRHRLGLLRSDLRKKILNARAKLMQMAESEFKGAVEFYDPDRFCVAAPLRENLLFGSIAHDIPGAARRAHDYMRQTLREQDLEREVLRLGLDQPVGLNGRLLQPTQRIAVALARCLLKRPSILILDQPLTAFDQVEARLMMDRVRTWMKGQTLLVAMRDKSAAAGFDIAIEFAGPRISTAPVLADVRAPAPPPSGPQSEIYKEVETLRSLAIFSDVDPAQLKLLAFASDRLSFAKGDVIFRQGDASDAAYVTLSGACGVQLDTQSGPIHLPTINTPTIIGEMGVISGAPRSATVIATSDITALRLSRDVLLSLLSQFPPVALAIMRDQIKRLVAAESRLAATQRMPDR